MNIERLTRLKEIMQTVHDEKKPFTLATWVYLGSRPGECGTTACAMGYAALDPEFQKQGLGWETSYSRYANDPSEDTYIKTIKLSGIVSRRDIPGGNTTKVFSVDIYPVYLGRNRFDAAAAFFGLNDTESRYLFSDLPYRDEGIDAPTALHVIAHLDRVLTDAYVEGMNMMLTVKIIGPARCGKTTLQLRIAALCHELGMEVHVDYGMDGEPKGPLHPNVLIGQPVTIVTEQLTRTGAQQGSESEE